MILGKGLACTEAGIIREYYQFLDQYGENKNLINYWKSAPRQMNKRIGKPLKDWKDNDILELYEGTSNTILCNYNMFMAFLFFFGYRRASLHILSRLPTRLSNVHKSALLPIRQRIKETRMELKYSPNTKISIVLVLLIWLLAVSGKQLEDITRSDFDAFRKEYQTKLKTLGLSKEYYQAITKIERFLIHWKILSPRKKVYKHDIYISRIKHELFKNIILEHINWYGARCQPKSVLARRQYLTTFFLWLQESHPKIQRLDDINRHIALDYLKHLKRKGEVGDYSRHYWIQIFSGIRLFFDFAVFEELETSPNRNPFGNILIPAHRNHVPRYIPDIELDKIREYCKNEATLQEKTIYTILLHTGIRASELARLRITDIVQIQGRWKLHVREGKGLKDRLIPLNPTCLKALQEWQDVGWEEINENLFTRNGRPWQGGKTVTKKVRIMIRKIGLEGITPHRFRHSFAVILLNHGLRESVVQKLLGHTSLDMTLRYAHVLDRTAEIEFNKVNEKIEASPLEDVPSFFDREDYPPFEEGDSLNWIRLPHGYCRRNSKIHCESDVKCLLCERYCAHSENLDCLEQMHERYQKLDMSVQAEVVYSHISQLKEYSKSKPKTLPHGKIAVP
jgi:site-specific recombinase XerD